MKKSNLTLIFIIAVAFFARTWDLGWNGFNGDESIYSGQAASLLGEQNYLKDFAVFRSHPILLQSLVSVAFAVFGIYDAVARIIPAIFGTLTVFVTYLAAKEFFDRRVGLVSCLIVALLPFHIVFSRQVLVDVPLSFFLILFIYLIAKYRMTEDNILCYWAGVSAGLCLISKEVGIITIPIFIAYTFLTRTLKVRKFFVFLLGCLSSAMPFILLILTREDAMNSLRYYSTWQVTRGMNEKFQDSMYEYFSILINEAFGYALAILIVVSIVLILKESRDMKFRKFRDHIILLVLTLSSLLLLYGIIATQADRFVITFIAPAVILGCAFLSSKWVRNWRGNKMLYILIAPLVILSNNFFISIIFPTEDLKLSDNIGTTWKRESAFWIKNNTSSDSGVLTFSQSYANTIRFYSDHDVYAIEKNKNPAYLHINADLLILNKNVTIIADDLTSEKFSLDMKKYIDRYKPHLVHTIFKDEMINGEHTLIPVIKIYQIQ